jgi:hypothetical protein
LWENCNISDTGPKMQKMCIIFYGKIHRRFLIYGFIFNDNYCN